MRPYHTFEILPSPCFTKKKRTGYPSMVYIETYRNILKILRIQQRMSQFKKEYDNHMIQSTSLSSFCIVSAQDIGLRHRGLLECHLTGWWLGVTPLKNMSSSIGMIWNSQYFWENIKLMATKPPSSYESLWLVMNVRWYFITLDR